MDPTAITWIKDLVSSVGFPIFVAVWLLWRTDRVMAELTTAMIDLKDVIQTIKNKG